MRTSRSQRWAASRRSARTLARGRRRAAKATSSSRARPGAGSASLASRSPGARDGAVRLVVTVQAMCVAASSTGPAVSHAGSAVDDDEPVGGAGFAQQRFEMRRRSARGPRPGAEATRRSPGSISANGCAGGLPVGELLSEAGEAEGRGVAR